MGRCRAVFLAVLVLACLCRQAACAMQQYRGMTLRTTCDGLLTWQEAIAACASQPLFRGVLVPGTLAVEALTHLVILEDPAVTEQIVVEIQTAIAGSPLFQRTWDFWVWQSTRPCSAFNFNPVEGKVRLSDRPCGFKLCASCAELDDVVRLGYEYSNYPFPGTPFAVPAVPTPSPSLPIDLDSVDFRLLTSPNSFGVPVDVPLPLGALTFNDTPKALQYGRLTAVIARSPLREFSGEWLRAFRPWFEGEEPGAEPPGSGAFWAATLQTAALNSAYAYSLDPSSGELVDTRTDQWFSYSLPDHDRYVAIEACASDLEFNTTGILQKGYVERLVLRSRGGAVHQWGWSACSRMFREDAPPGGYLFAFSGAHSTSTVILPAEISQLRAVWAVPKSAPADAQPTFRAVPLPVLPPTATPACPAAKPITADISEGCGPGTGLGTCPTASCCGPANPGPGTSRCVAQSTACKSTCSSAWGLCGFVPEASVKLFTPRVPALPSTSTSGAAGGQLLFQALRNKLLTYEEALTYCSSSTMLGLAWQMPSLQQLNLMQSDWLAANRDATVWMLLRPLWVLSAPEVVASNPFSSVGCLTATWESYRPDYQDIRDVNANLADCSTPYSVVCVADANQTTTPPALLDVGVANSSGGAAPAMPVWLPGPHTLVAGSIYGAGASGSACAFSSAALAAASSSNATASNTSMDLAVPLSAVGLSIGVHMAPPNWRSLSTEQVSALWLAWGSAPASAGTDASHAPPAPGQPGISRTFGVVSTGGMDTLWLQPGELVVAVSGCAGGNVERLVFHTSTGRRFTLAITHAVQCSQPFFERAPPGGYLYDAQGVAGFYLEQLQLVWAVPLAAATDGPAPSTNVSSQPPPSSASLSPGNVTPDAAAAGGSKSSGDAAVAIGVGVGVGVAVLLVALALIMVCTRRRAQAAAKFKAKEAQYEAPSDSNTADGAAGCDTSNGINAMSPPPTDATRSADLDPIASTSPAVAALAVLQPQPRGSAELLETASPAEMAALAALQEQPASPLCLVSMSHANGHGPSLAEQLSQYSSAMHAWVEGLASGQHASASAADAEAPLRQPNGAPPPPAIAELEEALTAVDAMIGTTAVVSTGGLASSGLLGPQQQSSDLQGTVAGGGAGSPADSMGVVRPPAKGDSEALGVDPLFNLVLGRDVVIDRSGFLGRGATGVVFRGALHAPAALALESGRRGLGPIPVAVKIIQSVLAAFEDDANAASHDAYGASGDGQQRRKLKSLYEEMVMLHRLSHPNIVRFYGCCLRPPGMFMAVELMQISLADVIHAQVPHNGGSGAGNGGSGANNGNGWKQKFEYTLSEMLRLCHDMASGLAYLHPTIVHRDLKPDNIMLDATCRAKLGDFGLAKFKCSTMLSTSNVDVGTAPYMAPECFLSPLTKGEMGVCARSDVYSLAVIMWEMLTRMRPWAKTRAVVIGYLVSLHQSRLPLPAPGPNCPAGLLSLIQRCWRLEPRERPSIWEVVKALELLLKEAQAAEAAAAVSSLSSSALSAAATTASITTTTTTIASNGVAAATTTTTTTNNDVSNSGSVASASASTSVVSAPATAPSSNTDTASAAVAPGR